MEKQKYHFGNMFLVRRCIKYKLCIIIINKYYLVICKNQKVFLGQDCEIHFKIICKRGYDDFCSIKCNQIYKKNTYTL